MGRTHPQLRVPSPLTHPQKLSRINGPIIEVSSALGLRRFCKRSAAAATDEHQQRRRRRRTAASADGAEVGRGQDRKPERDCRARASRRQAKQQRASGRRRACSASAPRRSASGPHGTTRRPGSAEHQSAHPTPRCCSRPRGGVPIDTCGGPVMAKTHRRPATSTRFWFVAEGGVGADWSRANADSPFGRAAAVRHRRRSAAPLPKNRLSGGPSPHCRSWCQAVVRSTRLHLSRSSHPLASGSNTAAQLQMQEGRLFVLAGWARSEQTPAEGGEITDRLLTIRVPCVQLTIRPTASALVFTESSHAGWPCGRFCFWCEAGTPSDVRSADHGVLVARQRQDSSPRPWNPQFARTGSITGARSWANAGAIEVPAIVSWTHRAQPSASGR